MEASAIHPLVPRGMPLRVRQDCDDGAHGSLTRGDRASVEYYLDKGASPNAPLSTGATPLKTAVVSHNVGVVEVLLRREMSIRSACFDPLKATAWMNRWILLGSTIAKQHRDHAFTIAKFGPLKRRFS